MSKQLISRQELDKILQRDDHKRLQALLKSNSFLSNVNCQGMPEPYRNQQQNLLMVAARWQARQCVLWIISHLQTMQGNNIAGYIDREDLAGQSAVLLACLGYKATDHYCDMAGTLVFLLLRLFSDCPKETTQSLLGKAKAAIHLQMDTAPTKNNLLCKTVLPTLNRLIEQNNRTFYEDHSGAGFASPVLRTPHKK